MSDVSTDRIDGHRAICKFQRAELIYKDGNLTELLDHATVKDPRGVSYFCGAPSTVVYPPMDTEAISRLLRELRIIAAFDYIVVDIPFDRFLMQEDLRDRATGTVLVTDATDGSQLKLARGYAALCQQVSEQKDISCP